MANYKEWNGNHIWNIKKCKHGWRMNIDINTWLYAFARQLDAKSDSSEDMCIQNLFLIKMYKYRLLYIYFFYFIFVYIFFWGRLKYIYVFPCKTCEVILSVYSSIKRLGFKAWEFHHLQKAFDWEFHQFLIVLAWEWIYAFV